jgi:ficolin
MKFSTRDVDNDSRGDSNCAAKKKSGWWYNSCSNADLNNKYLGGANNEGKKCVFWLGFKGIDYSLKDSEMKVGPDKV